MNFVLNINTQVLTILMNKYYKINKYHKIDGSRFNTLTFCFSLDYFNHSMIELLYFNKLIIFHFFLLIHFSHIFTFVTFFLGPVEGD